MRIIVATVARGPSARLTPEVERRVARALSDPVWTRRDGDRRDSWVASSGQVRIDVLTNEPPATGALIHRYPSGNAGAWSGHIDDPSFVADAPTPARVADLPGNFALVSATDQGVDAFTCVHRMEPLYLAEGRDVLVVSTSARVAHTVADIADRVPPLEALLGLSGLGRMITDATPFPGVTTVPADAHLTVRPTGTAVARLPGLDLDPRAPVEEVADRFVEALVAAAARAAAGAADPVSELTGGKDSRVTVAALAGAGVPFRVETSGLDAHPDVVLARRIAATLGVPHTLRSKTLDGDYHDGVVDVHPVEKAYRVLRGCEAMIFAYDSPPLDGRFVPDAVQIGGQAGEILRGGSRLAVGASSPNEVRLRVLGYLAPHRQLLAPPARARLAEIAQPWVDQHLTDPYRSSADLFREYGVGRWYAALRIPGTIDGPRREFLADNLVARIALSADPVAVAQERLIHAAVHRLCPQLCPIPFVGSRWGFESGGPSPECERGRWADRVPVPRLGGSTFEWRDKYPEQIHRHFAETIRSAPLYDGFLDRDSIEEFLDIAETPNRTYEHARLMWSLYTTSQLLLGLGERPAPPEGPRFAVTVPAAARAAAPVLEAPADPDALVRCNLCDAAFPRPDGPRSLDPGAAAPGSVGAGSAGAGSVGAGSADERCPECGLGPEHRSLRHVLDHYGDVFAGRQVLAVGATVPAQKYLFDAAAGLRSLDWATDPAATLRGEPDATQDAVVILAPPTAGAVSAALVHEAARLLRVGGVLVAVEPEPPAAGEPGNGLAALATVAGLSASALPGLDPVWRRARLVTLAYRD